MATGPSRSRPAATTTTSKSRSLEFTTQQLFYRDQYQKHSWQFKVGKRWSHSYVDDTELEVQRRNTTFAELAWVHTRYIGDAQLNLTLANRWGVSWFNGQPDLEPRTLDAPTYRYTLQTIDASLYAPFKLMGQSFNYIGALRAQATRSALFQSEQFSIGNRYTVRGFDGEQTLAAERGFYMRNELEMPVGQSGQALYLGLDAGRVFGPSAQYLLGNKMAGAAVGARGRVAGLRYDAFVGWALVKPAGLSSATPAAGFSLSYQY
jgi:hemolysin activation/secretion protein